LYLYFLPFVLHALRFAGSTVCVLLRNVQVSGFLLDFTVGLDRSLLSAPSFLALNVLFIFCTLFVLHVVRFVLLVFVSFYTVTRYTLPVPWIRTLVCALYGRLPGLFLLALHTSVHLTVTHGLRTTGLRRFCTAGCLLRVLPVCLAFVSVSLRCRYVLDRAFIYTTCTAAALFS